ncbi:hypothetical protein Trydic_g20530 [Trypoxylus dichotomus]
MNCIIPSGNIKIMNKALHALAKIGDELYIEAKSDYLQFATINQSKTSYITFNFHNIFFSTYELRQCTVNPTAVLTCKLYIKAMLNIFKAKGLKEKNIDWCKIEFEDDPTRILLKLKYKQDVVINHTLKLIDMEFVSVTYDKDKMPNQISTTGSFFGQVLTNFHTSDEDMSLDVKNNKVTVRNYDVASGNVGKQIRTQLVLSSKEFVLYKIGQECIVTMCFKPFRAAVSFAEVFTLPVVMSFDTGGKPVIVTIKNPIFEANFVLSTIAPDGSTQSCTNSTTSFCVTDKAKNDTLSKEGRAIVDSLNWDSDFEMEDNDIMMQDPKTVRDKNREENDKTSEPGPFHEDLIPESPESPRSKKLKIVFGRCFESTFHESKLDFGEELAPNSDSE